jgi:2-polyprenyl-6-methoxyphenol hydroxylase-like FAD-dependent oxidoreductase
MAHVESDHQRGTTTMIQPDDTSTQQQPKRFKVLIAGGGVAGLEAAFALHELAGELVDVTVLAPASEFVYRPDAVKEPFTRGYAHRYPLAGLVAGAGAQLVADALDRVDVGRRLAYTTAGAELSYDALTARAGSPTGRTLRARHHGRRRADRRTSARLGPRRRGGIRKALGVRHPGADAVATTAL